jgi:hypothetical protein
MSIRVLAHSSCSDAAAQCRRFTAPWLLAHKMLDRGREAARMLSILPRFAAARVSAHKYRTSA